MMFTDNHSTYTVVSFVNTTFEAPAKFKKYESKVEKQHPMSQVC
jgi:hypothetical protein